MDISITSNMRQIERRLTGLARQQLPFAMATALTGLGKRVQVVEQKSMRGVFDRPTPFTINAVGVKAARKNNPSATVFVRDVAASYLAPYEFGGLHKVGGRALLNPKAASLNQYGNLPRTFLARFKGRSDVFIGAVKTKKGDVINGVWQRPYFRLGSASARGKAVRGNSGLGKGFNTTGKLKLLVRFTDAQPVTKHLNYMRNARATVNTHFNAEFAAAMAKALASAR